MRKKLIPLFMLFTLMQTSHCLGQWVIVHVQINNKDSALNKILIKRETAVIAATTSYETILNSIESIGKAMESIRTKEYLKSPHDKNHYVATALVTPYVGLLTLPRISPKFFPLYSTEAKRDYFEKEIGLVTGLFTDMNITGKDKKTRNANTQELYLLRKEMILNLKKTTKNPKRVYALLFGVALINNLIYPKMDPHVMDFLINEI